MDRQWLGHREYYQPAFRLISSGAAKIVKSALLLKKTIRHMPAGTLTMPKNM